MKYSEIKDKSIDELNYEAFILASLLEVIIAMVGIKILQKNVEM